MSRQPLPPRLQRQAALIKCLLLGLLGLVFVGLALVQTGTPRLVSGCFAAIDIAWALWCLRDARRRH